MAEISEHKELNLKKFLFGKIGNKIILGFLLLVLVAAVTGFYIVNKSQNFMEKTIGENAIDTGQATLDSIDRITHRRLERWQEFANVNEALKKLVKEANVELDNLENKESYIQTKDTEWINSKGNSEFTTGLTNNAMSNMLRERTNFYKTSTGYDIFPEAFVTNKYGAIVALTGKTSDYNQADEAWWQNAKNNDYYVSDLIYDDSAKTYSLEIAISIKDRGEFIGVLKVIYSIDEIISIMDNVKKSLAEQQQQQQQVDFSLLNKEDKILYSTHNFTILQDAAEELSPILESGGYILAQHEGEEKLLAMARSRGYLTYPGQNWILIIEYPKNEIFAPVDSIKNTMISLVLIVAFIILLSGFLISKKITNPIIQLSDLAKQIQNKNFKARVDIKSRDELEELGDTFNRTIEVLDNLEKEKNQVDKAKTEFLSITSHELRSPMTPMKAQLQMILGDYFGKLSKEQRESLNIVLNNTERLDKIIVDFLEISRIEAARLKFNFIKADLSKTIHSVLEEMKGFMPEKKIKIETRVEKLPTIEVDPDRVSQVLRNLVNNAIKFTPENGKIEITAKVHSGMILFSVKDNGVGISEKDQRKLFEPFYQADNMYQHKSGGTGLGLAISKGIIESQNGKIWLNSEPGKGTIFYFTVPLKPVREMRAIKLLFSESEKIDENLKILFREYIGPLGDREFDNLKNSTGITVDSIKEFTEFLARKQILTKDNAEEFKSRALLILNKTETIKNPGKEVGLDISDLKKGGLIK